MSFKAMVRQTASMCYEGWKGTMSNNASFLLFFFYFCQIGHLYSFLCSPHYNKIIQRRDERRPKSLSVLILCKKHTSQQKWGGWRIVFSDIFPSYRWVKTLVFRHLGKLTALQGYWYTLSVCSLFMHQCAKLCTCLRIHMIHEQIRRPKSNISSQFHCPFST